MEINPTIQPTKKYHGKLIIVLIILILIILGFASLTRAGYISNYLGLDILCAEKNDSSAPYYLPKNGGAPGMEAKPVIYLYPAHQQATQVKLNYGGTLTTTYPKYDNGWQVIANPDGKITNLSDGKEYSYLFWEGEDKNASYDLSSGFVVKGADTAGFLQDKLAAFGLTAKEYNEFIVYWLPQMQGNKYNLVHFATRSEYDNRAKLEVTPKPDSLLRVFMTFKKLDKDIGVKPQEINPFSRNGFTVVEWGGTEIK